jgi:hypothetical protein
MNRSKMRFSGFWKLRVELIVPHNFVKELA